MSEPLAQAPAQGRNPVLTFFGWLLIVVGLAVAGLSGLCTIVFGAMMLSPSAGMGSTASGVAVLLIFGGIPFAIGAGIIFAGWAVLRASKPSPPSAKTFD